MATEMNMYRVYSIVPRPKQDDFWLNIAVAGARQKMPRTAKDLGRVATK
jgi:hypothetical protein